MPTVRINEATLRTLKELAGEDQSMKEVLERAVEELRRKRLLEQTNAAYAALRADPAAWAAEQEERNAWDTTYWCG